MNKKLKALLITSSLTIPTITLANNTYIGGSVGNATYQDPAPSDLDTELLLSGLTSSTTADDSDLGWKLLAGFEVNDSLSIEGSYVDLGSITYDTIITAPAVGTMTMDIEFSGFDIGVVGNYPVNSMFSVLGRVGIFFWDGEAKISATGSGGTATLSADGDGNDINFGIGGNLKISDQLNIRGEWQRFDIDGEDVDLLSASAVLTVGM